MFGGKLPGRSRADITVPARLRTRMCRAAERAQGRARRRRLERLNRRPPSLITGHISQPA